jgi:DNA-binding transcriptional LysR family regulator
MPRQKPPAGARRRDLAVGECPNLPGCDPLSSRDGGAKSPHPPREGFAFALHLWGFSQVQCAPLKRRWPFAYLCTVNAPQQPFELRELRAFLAVVEHRSFAKAAQKLGVSQPAISQSIKSLEAKLHGHVLFVRGPGRLRWNAARELTRVGKYLLARATHIVEEADAAMRSIQVMGGRENSVRLGIAHEYRQTLVPALASMLKAMPDVRIEMDVRFNKYLIERGVYEGSIDLGVVVAAVLNPERVSFHQFDEVPLQIAVSERHPLAIPGGARDIQDFKYSGFVMADSPSIGLGPIDGIAPWFRPKVVLETLGPDYALAAVRANSSLVTVVRVPRQLDRRGLVFMDILEPKLPPGWEGRTYPPLAKPLPRVRAHLIWRGNAPPTKEACRLADALRKYFETSGTVAKSGPASKR